MITRANAAAPSQTVETRPAHGPRAAHLVVQWRLLHRTATARIIAILVESAGIGGRALRLGKIERRTLEAGRVGHGALLHAGAHRKWLGAVNAPIAVASGHALPARSGARRGAIHGAFAEREKLNLIGCASASVKHRTKNEGALQRARAVSCECAKAMNQGRRARMGIK